MFHKYLLVFLPVLFSQNKHLPSVSIGLKCILTAQLKESSGLCYTDGNLWTFNDSGNPNEIYKIDSSSGAILQTVIINNYHNIDWEDITADNQYLYIGDFGNNHGNRTDLKIIRVHKSDLRTTKPTIKVTGEAINFKYEDQTDFSISSASDFDCESLISIGSSLYIFTKDALDFKTRCYKISNKPGNYSITPISTFDTKGKITGAAYNSESKEIALLGYLNKKASSFIWFLKGYSDERFFSGNNVKIIIGSGKDWQTEGIDYITTNRLFISCESSKSQPASLYFVQKY